jgi:site-specific DNA-methyltransferase (cytosine-N4-specific)
MKNESLKAQMSERFSAPMPLLLPADESLLKLEIKPYLQPFERDLAVRELRALLEPNAVIVEDCGYYTAQSQRSENWLLERLTYWQRLGRSVLRPTSQKALEFTQNGTEDFKKRTELHNARRLRYGPHDLHEYRGKFFPQLVRSLVNISNTSDDGLVLDPMCGSGTTPCEVVASGRSAIGCDLNPLSVLITTVKSRLAMEAPEKFHRVVTSSLDKMKFAHVSPEKTWNDEDLAYLKRWFDPRALKDIAAIRADIQTVRDPKYRQFFRVCLSNIIRSVSWQKEVDLRVRKEVRNYEPSGALRAFEREVRSQMDRIYPYLQVLPARDRVPKLTIKNGNAVHMTDLFPEHVGAVDLLVTSPPYATALPYLDTDRLSLIVLGLLPRGEHRATERDMIGTREVTERERLEQWERYQARRVELPREVRTLVEAIAKHNHGEGVGFRRRNLPALLGTYFLAMLDAMRSAHALMKHGAPGYYVVGNNSTLVDGEKVTIPTDDLLVAVGAHAGWKPEGTIPMELISSRDIFRENRGSAESILSFTA